MNYTITSPIGETAAIQAVQNVLYPKLNAAWELSSPNEIEGYGVAFINEKDGQQFPEAFTPGGITGTDYSGTLLTSDKSKFFFIPAGIAKPSGQTQFKREVDICFIVNLKEVKPAIAHRANSEVHADVEKVLRELSYIGLEIIGFAERPKNVFRDYAFKYTDDMQPAHVFKFTVSMLYSMNQKC